MVKHNSVTAFLLYLELRFLLYRVLLEQSRNRTLQVSSEKTDDEWEGMLFQTVSNIVQNSQIFIVFSKNELIIAVIQFVWMLFSICSIRKLHVKILECSFKRWLFEMSSPLSGLLRYSLSSPGVRSYSSIKQLIFYEVP